MELRTRCTDTSLDQSCVTVVPDSVVTLSLGRRDSQMEERTELGRSIEVKGVLFVWRTPGDSVYPSQRPLSVLRLKSRQVVDTRDERPRPRNTSGTLLYFIESRRSPPLSL